MNQRDRRSQIAKVTDKLNLNQEDPVGPFAPYSKITLYLGNL